MRVVKMPYVYWDSQRERTFYMRRFPTDLAVLTGEFFKHTYSSKMSRR